MNSFRAATLLSWQEWPLRIAFSVLAILSAAGVYQLSPRLAASPVRFVLIAFSLFVVEVLVFETGLRHTRIRQVTAENGTDIAVSEMGILANAIQTLTIATGQNQELLTAQAAAQAQLTFALVQLTDSVEQLKAKLFAQQRPDAPQSSTNDPDNIIMDIFGALPEEEPHLWGSFNPPRMKFSDKEWRERLKVNQITQMWTRGLSAEDISRRLSLDLRETEDLLERYVKKPPRRQGEPG
jgi:hypothetical protein